MLYRVILLLAMAYVASATGILFYKSSVGKNYVEAQAVCAKKGEELASVRNKEQVEFVQDGIKAYGNFKHGDCMLTGLKKVNNEWKLGDNTTAEYLNWATGYPKKEGKCACYMLVEGSAMLTNSYCIHNKKSKFFACQPVEQKTGSIEVVTTTKKPVAPVFITERPRPTTAGTAKGRECKERWAAHDDKCYREFFTEPVDKATADVMCRQDGGRLASITSKYEAKFLVEMSSKINRRYITEPWIDASKRVDSYGNVEWAAGVENTNTDEKCHQLIVSLVSHFEVDLGKVMEVNCDSTSSRYFCEYDVNGTLTAN